MIHFQSFEEGSFHDCTRLSIYIGLWNFSVCPGLVRVLGSGRRRDFGKCMMTSRKFTIRHLKSLLHRLWNVTFFYSDTLPIYLSTPKFIDVTNEYLLRSKRTITPMDLIKNQDISVKKILHFYHVYDQKPRQESLYVVFQPFV